MSDDEIELRIVSHRRGFRSVARLKRWLADRMGEDD